MSVFADPTMDHVKHVKLRGGPPMPTEGIVRPRIGGLQRLLHASTEDVSCHRCGNIALTQQVSKEGHRRVALLA